MYGMYLQFIYGLIFSQYLFKEEEDSDTSEIYHKI